jgi:hypothetical protein
MPEPRPPEPTVHVHLTIEVSVDTKIDTGVSVRRWNAMTAEQRSEFISELWEGEASSADNGGVSIITEGAAPT